MNYDGEVMEVSLPLRERGLKCGHSPQVGRQMLVAPFTGAWIEIEYRTLVSGGRTSRSLYGSVD